MHDALVVGRCQPLRNLHPVFNGLALRKRTAVQGGAKALAFQKFGNEKWRPVVPANVEHGKNVWMVQRGNGASLLHKPMQARCILSK